MRSEREPAECPHPSIFIQEEMETRGWDRWTLARHMGGDYRLRRLEIDLYFEVGPDEPNMRLGRTGKDIARVFDVSPEFLHNLEAAWLKSQGIPPAGRGDA
jgi:hypothetical protein